MHQSNTKKQRFYYGYIVVAVAFVIVMLGYGTRYAYGIFFKPLLIEFGWTRAITAGAFSISMIAYGLLGIVMGGLNDRVGPRIVLSLSGCLIALGHFLMPLVSSIWHLYLFYGVIIGIGMSGYWVPTLSTVARWFTHRRSMMTGIILSGMGLGTMLLSPTATWLIYTYDWRLSYIIMGSLVLVIFVSLAQLLKRDPSQMAQASHGANTEAGQGIKLNVTGFSLREAVYTSQFWLVFFLFFGMGVLLTTVLVHIVPRVTDLGVSPLNAASVLSVIGGLTIVSTLVTGIVADRIGNRQTFIIGYVLMSAAFFSLLYAREMWTFYLFAVVFGLGTGAGALGSPLLAALFGLRAHGLIFGVLNVGYNLGAALGPVFAGYIFDINNSYQIAFFVCALLGITSAIFSYLLKPTAKGSFGVKL